MVRLIFSIALLVVLAILVVFNARATTAFSLFGWKVEEVPVIAVALVSFVLGVVYSFVFYFLRFLDNRRRAQLKARGAQVRSRERAMALEGKEATRQEVRAPDPPAEAGEQAPRGRRKTRAR